MEKMTAKKLLDKYMNKEPMTDEDWKVIWKALQDLMPEEKEVKKKKK